MPAVGGWIASCSYYASLRVRVADRLKSYVPTPVNIVFLSLCKWARLGPRKNFFEPGSF